MPYISTTTNVKISDESEARIRAALGNSISEIRGKSERWLMLSFRDSVRMAFSGDTSPTAMIEVEIFGSASEGEYSRLTAKITDVISEELKIPKNRIYVKYEEISTWGWSGENF